MKLKEMDVGINDKIVGFSTKDRHYRQKLLRMGLVKGWTMWEKIQTLHFSFRSCRMSKIYLRSNPDKQTIEIGIAPSSMIFVRKNNLNETNLIE